MSLYSNEIVLLEHAPVLQVYYHGDQDLEIVDFRHYNYKTNTGYVLFQIEESGYTSTCIEKYDDCTVYAAKKGDIIQFYFEDNNEEFFTFDEDDENDEEESEFENS